ncbi:hypothetical protein NDU88_003796, partial [Pleurodeles waltl]
NLQRDARRGMALSMTLISPLMNDGWKLEGRQTRKEGVLTREEHQMETPWKAGKGPDRPAQDD